MFDFVRTNPKITAVVMGIMIIPFALVGGGGLYESFKRATDDVASVDGQDITRAEWDARQRQNVENLRRRGPNVDLKQLDTPAAKREALDALIRERVLLAAQVHQDLTPSDERVLAVFKTDPQFAQLRGLTKDQVKAVLGQQGMTLDGLFENIKNRLGQNQALMAVGSSAIVPATSTKAGLDAWFDQREIQWQRFDTKDFAAQIQPTEAQVQAYYADKAHQAEFKSPEEAKIDYVVFDIDALKSQVVASADEVKNYYEQNKAHYTVAEERRASHILVGVAPNASPADVAKAKAKADAIAAEVHKNPASFADVAKKESDDGGTKEQGGDLDFLTMKTAPAGAFADTLFAMKDGAISDPVRSSAGFHVIHMTGTRPGEVRPFEQVRPQIEDQLRTQLAQKAFASAADKFTNDVFEDASKLPAKVVDGNATYNLTKQTAVVHRKPAQGAVGPLASPRLLDAVFAANITQKKQNTDAVETGSSQLVSARVVDYQPERVRPLAEVRDQVVEAVRKSLASAAAKKDGEARLEAVRKDPKLALPLAATVGRTPTTPADVPRPVVDAALRADVTKGPVATGVALPDGGYAVVRVVKVVPRSTEDQMTAQAKTQFEGAFNEAEAQAVYASLKTRYKTKVREDAVARGSAPSASGASN